MKRIILAAVIVSLVTVGAFPATKAKTKTARTQTATAQSAPKVPLAALFPAPAAQQEIAGPGGMVSMDAPNHEVVMVRINDDSTRSHACVNTEAAARAFLNGPKNASAPVKQEN